MDVIRREGARVILLDALGRVLLIQGGDPAAPEVGLWWFTPGGGVDEGESQQAAAVRELREETGFVVTGELGPVVHERTAGFTFQGRPHLQHEVFFRAVLGENVQGGDLDRSGWTELERDSLTDVRWWSAEELRTTSETVYPEYLVELLDLLDG
ncbi:NUDIX domain-containing protein [Kineosporia rhizophila]|uniref:NUDIX hydrolase n=1 Tax=Kineosporia TaxID=49184 RepID=UPI000AF6BB34|nr:MULTISPECIES: NUDIX domain-containing protein [Kineosporia]MCE0533992.1 NUDIX domain-containing protein [Kineosporia rhizophila]GLY13532.1 DNA mismatch repair protein MutT [Kineosporia sp. NBRC 101677]